MDMKIQLDPKQIDKATKDLLRKQSNEISKLKRKVDDLEYKLKRVEDTAKENDRFKGRVSEAKRVLRDLLDIDDPYDDGV